MALKILCVYHNAKGDFFEHPPSGELNEHEVWSAHNYDQAVRMMKEAETGDDFEPFDIVLADVFLPYAVNGKKGVKELVPHGPMLVVDIATTLVRGLGLFLPEGFCVSDDTDQYGTKAHDAVVISSDCYAFQGRRDWQKMLGLVLSKLEELDGTL